MARRPRPRPRPWSTGAIVTVLALTGMTTSLMQTLLIPIQGELPTLLDASRGDTAWVVTITLLASAVCTPIAGRLGDMFGKRRVTLALLGLLVVGSAVAALSVGLPMLIVGRALQGCGMGVIALGIAIVRDVVEPRRAASSIALVSATLGVGGALGLPFSAVITEHLDWRLLFWTSAALGILVTVAVALVVPESPRRTGGRVDVAGALGLAIGVSGVLLALSKGDEWGWSSAPTLIALIGGVLVLGLWLVIELRVRQPLVDVRVSARPPVLLTNAASIAMGFALFTSSVAFPQLLSLPTAVGGLGLSLLEASLLLVPSGLAMLAMAPVAGRIERRVGPKPLLVGGAAILMVVYGAAAVAPLSVLMVLALNATLGIGIGLGYAAMPMLIMRAVPVDETAAANGLNTLMRALGTSVAAAAIGAIIAARSTTPVGGELLPTSDAFTGAFILGIVAAAVAAVLACCIPSPRTGSGRGAALPR